MLRKDLLRVSRSGGGYRPEFVGREARPLAARVLGTFAEAVGETRAELDDRLDALEADADDFKLVRGLASLAERDAAFETRAPVPPERARRVAFETAEAVGVVTESDRETAVGRAADRLGVEPDAVEASLYADRDANEVLAGFDPRWDPDGLIEQYNLSLAQTALFDATEVRVRSADPKALVSAVKRLRLMYEIRKTDAGREVVVTGPDALFRRTRRYGTAFARLLRTVAAAPEWRLEATVDDRGTERLLTLSDGDVSVPGVEPLAEPSFDSGVEAEFAGRFRALDLDWELVREPEPLETGNRVMIPDFAFDYAHADFRVFFEVMGFWTPAYVEKKLDQLDRLEDVEMVVAVDESLGVGEEIAARDHRVVSYAGDVRVKDVVDVLREYEADLLADAAAALPESIVPDADAVTLAALADEYGVAVDAMERREFPDHERVGRTLVRPALLDELRGRIEPGMDLGAAEEALRDAGIEDASAALSRLGYRVAWEGLGGGTVREKDDE
ncbi:DUF790 family protein [Haloparvum alkalitolerans]|uniref:DUF790 family protein n=1 Tax=Haloparvum alkalitolerans TaxID=1042953 RepID=UPI003CEFCB17